MRMTSRTPSSKFKIAVIEVAVDSDGAEDGVGFAGGAMNVEAAADQAVDYVLDLRVAGPSCITMTI